MNSLAELERAVWKRIQLASERKQSASLAQLGALADEMERKKREWISRLEDGVHAVDQSAAPEPPGPRPIADPVYPTPEDLDFTGRRIRGFALGGVQKSANTFKELLLGVANVLRNQDREKFDAVAVSLGGRKRRYFSQNPSELKYAHPMDGGGLFVETNLNANLIVKICFWLIDEFGLPRSTLNLRT